MILDLQLDASALTCHQFAPDDLCLHPDLATLADNQTLWRSPPVKVQTIVPQPGGIVTKVPLENVDWGLVCNEPDLVLPGDGDGCADIVSYSCEPVSEIDGRWRGVREREAEEEGSESAPGRVVVGRQRGLSSDRVGENSV